MGTNRRKIPGKERTTPQTRTFYMSDPNFEKLEEIAEKLRKMGIPGLYHEKRGVVNKSAVLAYLIEKFDKFLSRVPEKAETDE